MSRGDSRTQASTSTGLCQPSLPRSKSLLDILAHPLLPSNRKGRKSRVPGGTRPCPACPPCRRTWMGTHCLHFQRSRSGRSYPEPLGKAPCRPTRHRTSRSRHTLPPESWMTPGHSSSLPHRCRGQGALARLRSSNQRDTEPLEGCCCPRGNNCRARPCMALCPPANPCRRSREGRARRRRRQKRRGSRRLHQGARHSNQ
jgi:hypothetical protein